MLASIVPLGERARNRRWGVTATAYIIGSVVAGAALGAVLGVAGGSPVDPRVVSPQLVLAMVATLCALGAAIDGGVVGVSLPTLRRQVNEDWLSRYRGWVCGVGFGFQLGLGLITIVTTATVYLVFVIAFLSASWRAGAILGGTFGLARALPIFAMARVTTPAQLTQAHRLMQRWAPFAARAAVGVQGTIAVIGMALVTRV